jgi:hypothetical protein
MGPPEAMLRPAAPVAYRAQVGRRLGRSLALGAVGTGTTWS